MDAIASLGINWQSLLAQVANFALLLILLRLFLYKPVVDMLDKRKKKIADGLKQAEEAEKKLENASRLAQEEIDKANQKAQSIIKTAKEDSAKEAAVIIGSAKDKAKEIVESAKKQAELEKDNTIGKAKLELGEIVMLATEKIIEDKPNEQDIEKILEKINK